MSPDPGSLQPLPPASRIEAGRFRPSTNHGGSSEARGWWRGLTGSPEPDRIYAGLWALHLRRVEDGLSAHHLIGAAWRGFFAGTFVNTHDGRSVTAGIGRSVVVAERRDAGLSLGYRLGLLAGYDERLMGLAARWPVIPAAQIAADVRYGRFGVQAGWSWIVVTIGGFVSLGG